MDASTFRIRFSLCHSYTVAHINGRRCLHFANLNRHVRSHRMSKKLEYVVERRILRWEFGAFVIRIEIDNIDAGGWWRWRQQCANEFYSSHTKRA